MRTTSTATLATLLFVSSVAVGCMPQQHAPPPSTSSGPAFYAERHVYRFDFVVTATDGTNPPTSTSFTLNLQDGDKGEMVVGKNVALSSAPPPPPGGTAAPGGVPHGPRQDVGLKVASGFRALGDDVMLDVVIEMSSFDPPSTVRKVVAKGNALATSGKPSLVTTLEDDHKRYQLTVTPTKLR